MSKSLPKVIAFDLDGTIVTSKSNITPEMAEVLCGLLEHTHLAIISGAGFSQIETQVMALLPCQNEKLANFLVFPNNGDMLYIWSDGDYKEQSTDLLSPSEKKTIVAALDPLFDRFSIARTTQHGTVIEDRGGQITFSALGQHAPIELKAPWDPDQKIRKQMKAILDPQLPHFEVQIGGTTSIDITRKGINKAYAIRKMLGHLGLDASEALFYGDALFPGGNDASAQETGVKCISVANPQDTLADLRAILQAYEAGN